MFLMKRSKLEVQLAILKVLEQGKLMSPTQILYKVNICSQFLRQHLDYLIEQNLMERKVSGGSRAKYVITRKGLDALRTYGELQGMLAINEEYTLLSASHDS